MERRVLLAVFLSFLVLYVYQAFIGPPPGEPVVDTPGLSDAPPVETGRTTSAPETSQRRPLPRISPVEHPDPDPVIGETTPLDVIVESDWFRATFANRGAVLVSWQLKEYLEAAQPVELVPLELPSDEPWPFSLEFEDEELNHLSNEALFRPSVDRLRLADEVATLDFDYEDASGLRIKKTFRFDPSTSPYLFTATVEATLGTTGLNPALRWGPALGGVESNTSGFAFRQGPRGLLYGRVLENGARQFRDVMRFLMTWNKRERRPFKVVELSGIIAEATGVEVGGVIERWMKPPIK